MRALTWLHVRYRLDDACCSAFFFGKDGRGKLTLPKFEAFMKARPCID
jgi:hypothetical protein